MSDIEVTINIKAKIAIDSSNEKYCGSTCPFGTFLDYDDVDSCNLFNCLIEHDYPTQNIVKDRRARYSPRKYMRDKACLDSVREDRTVEV